MPSLGVQELLVRQERARIERLSRDAWKRDRLTATPARNWLRALGRPSPDDGA